MQDSPYQTAIYQHFEKMAGHSAVVSVAGSGKTYTAINSVGHIPAGMSVLMAAFNTDIKLEFQKRLTEKNLLGRVKPMTFNGFGWGICLRNMTNKPELDAEKTRNILEFKVLPQGDSNLNKLISPVKRMVGLLKSYCTLDLQQADTRYEELMDHYDIDIPDGIKEDSFKTIITETFGRSLSHMAHFDFDDQKFMPIYMGWPVSCFDQVIVDEFQDTCPVEMNLLWQAAKGGQLAGFGDPDQAIYGFKGATPDAFDKYIKVANATTLPLSICYRCPISVIKAAQSIVPRIEWAPGAMEGSVNTQKEQFFYDNVKPGDFVLCRTNDELVSKCVRLIKKKIPAKIRGRDFGSQIERLIDRICNRDNSVRYSKMNTNDMDIKMFITLLTDYQMGRTEQLEKLRREAEIIRLEDQCSTIRALADEAKTVGEIKNTLSSIFSDQRHSGVDLMTIHKSKGLQSKRVWILRPDLLPHPAAKKEWMRKEENRLKYVAITRAEQELNWVQPEKKNDR